MRAEPHPSEKPLAEPIGFGKGQQGFGHAAAEDAEVAHVFGDLYVVGHAVEPLVKRPFEPCHDFAFVAHVLVGSDHIGVGMGAQVVEHGKGQCRRLLQIGVDKAQGAAARGLHARIDGAFLAEVAREGNHLHGNAPIGIGRDLAQARKRGVATPVVDEDEFDGYVRFFESLHRFPVEGFDVALFVEAGNDQRKVDRKRACILRACRELLVIERRMHTTPFLCARALHFQSIPPS